jgi:hypothetical protein
MDGDDPTSNLLESPSAQKPTNGPTAKELAILFSIGAVILFLFGWLIFSVLIPGSRRVEAEKKAAYEASLAGPKILEELLEEIKLIRIALEKQR